MILACNGFGGNPELVRRHIPEMAGALYFGHPGNRGDAIIWGDALGAQLSHLSAYQGHGSVATPHNILITWATKWKAGIQVNGEGRRFCDEARGYSEQAAEVLRQPGDFAWTVFDERIAAVARQFDDFRKAESAGAILMAHSIASLSNAMRVPIATFTAEWNAVENLKSSSGQDRYGRSSVPTRPASRHCTRQGYRRAVSYPGRACRSIQKDASSAKMERTFPTCLRRAARPPACRARQRQVISLATAF